MESNDVFVYLPPGYDTAEESFPVIYIMPGLFVSQLPPQEGVSAISYLLDGLWEGGRLPMMMLVFCEGGGPLNSSPLFVVNSSFQGDVPRFCAKDVVEYIDANYQTLPAPAGRWLLAVTLTGDAALRMAAAYSHVFSAVFIYQPWVLAQGTLAETYFTQPTVREVMLGFADQLKDVPPDEVGTAYLELTNQIGSAGPQFTLMYAMDYMAEPEPPYFSYLYTDVDTPADPEVWDRREAGLGDLGEKVAQGKEGLMQLAGLGIEPGNLDNFSPWAQPGQDELHQVLEASNFPHWWDEFPRGSVTFKLTAIILVFFAEYLETEPSS